MSTPKMPDVPNPAKRPERADVIEADDIEIGTGEEELDPTKKGRRSLRKPSASTGLTV